MVVNWVLGHQHSSARNIYYGLLSRRMCNPKLLLPLRNIELTL